MEIPAIWGDGRTRAPRGLPRGAFPRPARPGRVVGATEHPRTTSWGPGERPQLACRVIWPGADPAACQLGPLRGAPRVRGDESLGRQGAGLGGVTGRGSHSQDRVEGGSHRGWGTWGTSRSAAGSEWGSAGGAEAGGGGGRKGLCGTQMATVAQPCPFLTGKPLQGREQTARPGRGPESRAQAREGAGGTEPSRSRNSAPPSRAHRRPQRARCGPPTCSSGLARSR